MKQFKDNQRVRFIVSKYEPSSVREEWLPGKIGTVVRLRMSDDGAWVRMDDAIPDEIASFPASDKRRNHVLLYPHECEPEHRQAADKVKG